MLRQFSFRRIVVLFLLDWLGTIGLAVAAAYIRSKVWTLPRPLVEFLQDLGMPVYLASSPQEPFRLLPPQVLPLIVLIWPVVFITFSIYDGRRNDTLTMELRNVSLAVSVSTLLLSGVLFFTYRGTGRAVILLFYVLDLVLLTGARLAFYAYRRAFNPATRPSRRRVLVVGAGAVGQRVVAQIEEFAARDLNLVGFLDDDPGKAGCSFAAEPVIGTIDELEDVVNGHRIEEAVVALPLRAHSRVISACTALQKCNVRVYVVPDLFALSFPNSTLDGFGGIPLICLGQPGVYGWQRFLKRAFDITVSCANLVLTVPLMAVIALLIKSTSRGPVVYRQTRIGERGRLFTMYKFRTMANNTDPSVHKTHVQHLIEENLSADDLEGGKSLKMDSDPRVTKVGRFLRKTSLDELPQLFNVLRGEMSLVGPRPPLDYEVGLYKDWHRRRFATLPGITGLWQVKARNMVSFDEMVRMDIEYINNQSLWLDLKILLLTPFAVLTGRGAG
ncbi:MAG: sugar transferase [Acidobacteriota bacterium]